MLLKYRHLIIDQYTYIAIYITGGQSDVAFLNAKINRKEKITYFCF